MSATDIKTRPILFKGEMVRAILGGQKTQTRRIMKPQPTLEGDRYIWGKTGIFVDAPLIEYKCPYGRASNRLWVKETWYQGTEKLWYKADIEDLSQCGISGWKSSMFMPRTASRITLEVVKVRVERLQDISEEDAIAEGIRRIGDTFPQSGDFWKKGPNFYTIEYPGWSFNAPTAKECFAHLWDSINGKSYPWSANPWLWVVEFKRVDAIATQQEVTA
jgi:hypothetical protein